MFEEYQAHLNAYGELTERLPTRAFLTPLEEDEEIEIELAKGVKATIKCAPQFLFLFFCYLGLWEGWEGVWRAFGFLGGERGAARCPLPHSTRARCLSSPFHPPPMSPPPPPLLLNPPPLHP